MNGPGRHGKVSLAAQRPGEKVNLLLSALMIPSHQGTFSPSSKSSGSFLRGIIMEARIVIKDQERRSVTTSNPIDSLLALPFGMIAERVGMILKILWLSQTIYVSMSVPRLLPVIVSHIAWLSSQLKVMTLYGFSASLAKRKIDPSFCAKKHACSTP